MGLILVAVACTSGCLVRDPLYCHPPDDPCTDPSRPVCDVDGQFDESDHIKNTCIPTPPNCPPEICGCTPGSFLSCDATGANEIVCGADGMSSAVEACANGCDASLDGCRCTAGETLCVTGALETCQSSGGFGNPTMCPLGCASDGVRCTDISASNGLNAALDAPGAREDFTLNDGATIDTTSGLVTDPIDGTVAIPSMIVAQSGAPPIRAYYVRSIVVHRTTVTGTDALAIVADESIAIEGTVEARATGTTGGAGSISSTTCDGASSTLGFNGTFDYGNGAGGGGGGTSGAPGGVAGAAGSVGYPGGAPAGPATVEPLVGGCRGGDVYANAGGLDDIGGAGGGAIQLVARGSISIDRNGAKTGIVDVGGTGGDGVGAGGGAGGQVLLEAPMVIIDGSGAGIYANGGAGGACSAAGADAATSAQPAAAPQCGTASGGNGGTGATAPTGGALRVCSPCPAGGGIQGGGGAAVGRARINDATGTFAATGGAAISAVTTFGTIGTR